MKWRATVLLLVLLLAGCARPAEELLEAREADSGMPEAMVDAEVAAEAEAVVVAAEPEVVCLPDDDDGIGGTGCAPLD